MQSGVSAHERRAPRVVDRALHRGAQRGQRVALSGNQPHVIGVARADDAGLHATPQEHAVVGWLTTTARVEGRAIEHDALLRVDRHDCRGPLAQGGVLQLEPGGPHAQRPWLATAAAAVAAASGSRYSPPGTMGRRSASSR